MKDLNLKKIAAEGIKLVQLKGAILKDCEQNKTGGWRYPNTKISSSQLAHDIHGGIHTMGGYMFSSLSATSEDSVLHEILGKSLEYRWVKEVPREPEVSKDVLSHALDSAKIGAIVNIYYSCNESWSMDYRKDEDGWVLYQEYNTRDRQYEEENLNLTAGIRSRVASKLGVECSSTFHEAFDHLVEVISG